MSQLPLQSDFQQPFTRERQVRFLEALSLTGNVRAACRHVAIAPPTAYRWRRSCRHFACGWDAAMVVARAAAEEALADRAMNGVEETVFYHGEEVATRRRYDSRLLLAHLARLDAKAQDRNIADAATDFDAVLAHFGKTGELPEVAESGAAEDGPGDRAGGEAGACEGARSGDHAGGRDDGDQSNATAPEHPWEDESLPIVERALLFLESGRADDGDADDEDDFQEEFAVDGGGADPAGEHQRGREELSLRTV